MKSCVRGSYWPILLKKSVRPNSLVIDWLKRIFCTLLREIRARKPRRHLMGNPKCELQYGGIQGG